MRILLVEDDRQLRTRSRGGSARRAMRSTKWRTGCRRWTEPPPAPTTVSFSTSSSRARTAIPHGLTAARGADLERGWPGAGTRAEAAGDLIAPAEVIEDAVDESGLCNEGDHAHLASAARTDEGVDFVDAADQLRPPVPEGGAVGSVGVSLHPRVPRVERRARPRPRPSCACRDRRSSRRRSRARDDAWGPGSARGPGRRAPSRRSSRSIRCRRVPPWAGRRPRASRG